MLGVGGGLLPQALGAAGQQAQMLSSFCGRNVWDLHVLKGGGNDVSVVVCVFGYVFTVGRPACRMCQVKVVVVFVCCTASLRPLF